MNQDIDPLNGQSNDPKEELASHSLLSLSRRQLLKALAAVLGAAALSSLPNQWKTPVVEIGALPAHAQTSSKLVVIHGSQTFATGGSSSFQIPAGITSLTIEAWGAEGGQGGAFSTLAPIRNRSARGVAAAGMGGYVKAIVTVTPAEVLTIVVGTLGADGVSSDGSGPGLGGPGGSQGGVTTGGDGATSPLAGGGGGGGGASYVLRGASTLTPLVVAGAGGGHGGQGAVGGSAGSGGVGGGTTGGNGSPASGNAGAGGSPISGGTGGIGGTTAPTGTGGTDGGVSSSGNPGQGGQGGPGSVGASSGGAGGGGGGGWTGGGGGGGGGGEGGAGGGGGGGSSFTIPGATGVVHLQGVKSGNGQVTLTW